MANPAKLEITVINTPSIGDEFSFSTTLTAIVEECAIISTTNRYSREVSSLENQAESIKQALIRDYGFGYLIVRAGATVSIEADGFADNFSNITFNPTYFTTNYTPPVAPDPEFEIDDITAQAADTADRNTHARFNVSVLNGTANYDITAPVLKSGQIEPLFFDYLRQPATIINTSITDSNSDIATFPTPTVDFFTLDSVDVNESQSGATVIVNTTTTAGDINTTKEYSIDNIIWQQGASFTGVLSGNYTLYVRDNLGANYSLPFEVVGVSVDKPEPYAEIVNTNPLRHILRIDYNCENIPNWNNALFAKILEEQFPNVEKRGYGQLIADCDIINTQIRTSYDNLTVNVFNCDDEIVNTITPELKKENILKKDKRDCYLSQVSSGNFAGKTFLYFPGGNIYIPDTTTIDKTYNNTEKKVFPFAENGQLFTITSTTSLNGDYTQLGTIFDTATGYYGIVLDVAFTGDPVQTGIVQTIYNEKVYNIWEYSLVGTSLTTGGYRIEVDLQDGDVRYKDLKFDTEPICKLSSTENTVVFDSQNSEENTANVDFTTGINFRMRIGGRFIVANNTEDNIDFKSQQGRKVLLKSTITRSMPFESDLVPFYIAEKLAILSSLDTLKINNANFVKGEEVENENKASERNPFVLITRDYQEDNQITISDSVGLVTEAPQVIGTTSTTVIGI